MRQSACVAAWCHVRPVPQLAVNLQELPRPEEHTYPPPDVVLVLGFYDRGNAGDEMYKVAIPRAWAAVTTTTTLNC